MSDARYVIPKAIILLLLLLLALRMTFYPYSWIPFAPLDLVVHEVGHPLFSFFGEWMHYAGGTVAQLAFPIMCLFILLNQGESFGLPVCGVWFGANLLEISEYMADARDQVLPLVTLGIGNEAAEVEYTDWEYLFSHTPGFSLEYDVSVAFAAKIVALILVWLSVGMGAWLIRKALLKNGVPEIPAGKSKESTGIEL